MAQSVLSVGIDIGTSTTQLIFSRLELENTGSFFSVPKIDITEKKVIYKSAVHLTPLLDGAALDAHGIRDIVESEYSKAGFVPGDTDTGAVIITGESARKDNAAVVLEALSSFAGDFVVSTAGPDLESILAGKGSSAQSFSKENSCVTVNFDIGGGTTNIAAFDCGETVACGCLDIGGRLVKTDGSMITYVSPSAEAVCREYSIPVFAGRSADLSALKALSERFAALMAQALEDEREPLYQKIVTPGSSPFVLGKPVRYVCFSGGVADCIYKTDFDDLEFGDIGVLLGRAVRSCPLTSDYRQLMPQETIRATVVGAGTYTTSVSGSTISYTPGLFPLKNVPVYKLSQKLEQSCLDGDSQALADGLRWFTEQNDTRRLLLAMKGRRDPSYGQILTLSRCIADAVSSVYAPDEPLLLLVESDMAKALGQALRPLLGGRGLVCIDSVYVENNNFIDLGHPMMDGLVIPVVVKTLIFG